MNNSLIKLFNYLIAIIICVSLVFSLIACSSYQAETISKEISSLKNKDLETELLREQVISAKLENIKSNSFWGLNSSIATFISSIIALVTILYTIWQYLLQRKSESLIRVEENFQSVISDLGSEKDLTRSNSIVSIVNFMKPKYHEFHEQIYNILLANLYHKNKPPIDRLLVKSFEKILKICIFSKRKYDISFDFSKTKMDNINLAGLNLSKASLYNTSLKNANLRGIDLYKVEGYRVDFSGAKFCKQGNKKSILKYGRFQESKCTETNFMEANLIGIKLKHSDLKKAKFQRSELQSAHFEYSKLNGARFEQADLNNTYFTNAYLDDAAFNSIINAKSWRKAIFSPKDRERLDHLAETKKCSKSKHDSL